MGFSDVTLTLSSIVGEPKLLDPKKSHPANQLNTSLIFPHRSHPAKMVTLFPTQSLAKDLSEAEEQYAHALRSHLHNIDHLLALQRCRLNLLEENYNMELETLTKEFEIERYGGLSPREHIEPVSVSRWSALSSIPP